MAASTPTEIPVTAPSNDYTYAMDVHAPLATTLDAITNPATIGRWWTIVSSAERSGATVQLFMGDSVPLVGFTLDQGSDGHVVNWAVTSCVVSDWVGTTLSFTVTENADETCHVAFSHVGLVPALECFDECQVGWNHYMPSLQQFLETGEGIADGPSRA